MLQKFKDTAAIVREYEEIARTQKTNIIRIAFQQSKVFKRFKEKKEFIQMVDKFGVS